MIFFPTLVKYIVGWILKKSAQMNKEYIYVYLLTLWLLVLICCFVHINKQKPKRATKVKGIKFVELCEVWQILETKQKKNMLRIVKMMIF